MITPLIYFFNLIPLTFIFFYNRSERFAAFLTLSRLPFANIKVNGKPHTWSKKSAALAGGEC